MSARLAVAAVAAWLALLLAADAFVQLPGQLVLGAATWAVLLAACARLAPERRAQVAVVVAVATCGEVLGSIVWGVYTYRLENLPTFVPPAHGLVYLGGVALALWLRRHARALVRVALVALVAWGVAGVTILPREDWGGAIGVPLLAYVLLRSRSAPTYAGVFLVVAGLELYGTALGTWTWAQTIPGTGIPNGNPPSGVAAGYVFFDVCAIALAPRLLVFARRMPRPRRVAAVAAVVAAALAVPGVAS